MDNQASIDTDKHLAAIDRLNAVKAKIRNAWGPLRDVMAEHQEELDAAWTELMKHALAYNAARNAAL
jgi:hypothetical protein